MLKRIFAITAVLVLIATMAGCSNQSKDQSDSTDSVSASNSQVYSNSSDDVIRVAGLDFDRPSDFEWSESNSTGENSYYYAERGADATVMIMAQTVSQAIDQKTDLKTYGDEIIQGIAESSKTLFQTQLADIDIEVYGLSGRLVAATGSYKDVPTEALFAIFFNSQCGEVGFLGLVQTATASRDYKSDFIKMLDQTTSDAAIKETLGKFNERSANKPEEKGEGKPAELEGDKKETEKQAETESGKQNLEETFPVETARKAATVALTNSTAYDVFASDGNSHDPSRYHSFSDKSGYYLELIRDGAWSQKDDSTWHVNNIWFAISGSSAVIKASLDVSFDSTNYIVSNVSGTEAIPGKEQYGTSLKSMLDWRPDGFCALTVTPELLE